MSKFSELFKEAKQTNESPTTQPKARKKTAVKKVTKSVQTKAPAAVRVTGRRSDPSYTGAFAYIPLELHEQIKRQIFGRKDLDFSALVEQLLGDWLKKQK